jgi:nitrate/TMAO reductase-like tetraheme cytochrome c subunit
MKKTGNKFASVCGVAIFFWGTMAVAAEAQPQQSGASPVQPQPSLATGLDYERARWHPLHFKPAIDTATNEQCLSCHQEVLEPSVKAQSPAGVKAADSLAWYQTLEVYAGEQETFHRRHLATPLAQRVMDLKCNFCHQGNSLREEAPIPPTNTTKEAGFTLRKMVDPGETCLRCHGTHPYELMGLPGSWEESRESLGNSCTSACHVAIRTNRHQVNYLKADEIEKAGQENNDTCYGCHGGRQWYRISYSYPRHAWPGMPATAPDWAKDRPTESDPRFRLDTPVAASAKDSATSTEPAKSGDAKP